MRALLRRSTNHDTELETNIAWQFRMFLMCSKAWGQTMEELPHQQKPVYVKNTVNLLHRAGGPITEPLPVSLDHWAWNACPASELCLSAATMQWKERLEVRVPLIELDQAQSIS